MKPISLLALLVSMGFGSAALQQALLKNNKDSAPNASVSSVTGSSTGTKAQPGVQDQQNEPSQGVVVVPQPVVVGGGNTYIIDEWGRRVERTTLLDDRRGHWRLGEHDRFGRDHASYDNPLNRPVNSRTGAQRSGGVAGSGPAYQQRTAGSAPAAHVAGREAIMR